MEKIILEKLNKLIIAIQKHGLMYLIERTWHECKLFGCMVQVIIFSAFPTITYLLVLDKRGRYLPKKKERINKTDNPLDDWIIISDGGFRKLEITIVMRTRVEIEDYSNATQIITINAAILKDKTAKDLDPTDYGGERVLWEPKYKVTYMSCDSKFLFPAMAKNKPIIFVELVKSNNGRWVSEFNRVEIEKKIREYCLNHPESYHIQLSYAGYHAAASSGGSGLICTIAISKLAQKVTIHGWDCYMDSPLAKKSYWGVINALIKTPIKAQFKSFECCTAQWLYATRLQKSNNIRIHGYIKDVVNYPKIVRKLEKLYYNNV